MEQNHLCNYFAFEPVVPQNVSFDDFSIFSSGGHLFQPSKTIYEILAEGTMANIPLKLFYS